MPAARSLISLLLVLCVVSCGESKVDAIDPAESPAAKLLREYIRIDTTNPPGNETAGATFLAERLLEAGVEARLLGDDPDRRSLYARLESGSDSPALLLLHHIDVVPAHREGWTIDPFGGEVRGGYVWGRGAIDAKSLGVAHLLGFIDLAQNRPRLVRDVVFLAVADEEGGGLHGVAHLLEKYPELFTGVGFVLNEGGGNRVVVDDATFWGIEIDQKVPLWVEIVASGAAGHGAGMHDDSAIMRLLRVLDRVRAIEPDRRVIPTVRMYFRSLSEISKGKKEVFLREIDRYLDSSEFDRVVPETYVGLLQDTWTVTVLEAGERVNVVPERARAEIDIRLLPGSDPSQVLEQLRTIAGSDADVEVLLMGRASESSPIDTELWGSLERVIRKDSPHAVVGPMVAYGATDSRFFRERGIVAYGFSPFKINYYDLATVHGLDERIRLIFFLEGVELTRRIIEDFCLTDSSARTKN